MFAKWWWTIDLYFSCRFSGVDGARDHSFFCGKSAVAERIGLDSYHFVERQALFMIPAFAVMIVFLSSTTGKSAGCAGLLAVTLTMMIAVLFVGVEVKGSRRWLQLAGVSLQPSEFMKPAFVIIAAWLFAERARHRKFRATSWHHPVCHCGRTARGAADLGQTMLVTATWGPCFSWQECPGCGSCSWPALRRWELSAPIQCFRMWRPHQQVPDR